ncbi:uncharacterized protein LOC107797287 [Nicotiana tabacum]|uniref:Uncharacterized protein LOC107797287 n=1 Tax=Nicotiana tabacum TaxID=4097 RepID=A0A1S4AG35_TOBAC|nr:PREDICTED: uncharacterized protein LOC107797287 [Nicotiana tabacum]
MTVSLSSGVANCNSLRKLFLSEVFLNDNILQTLLTSCPLIESFILKHCFGLEKIELSNLQKIRSVSIWTLGKQHVKIQAPTLERLLYCGHIKEPRLLDIVECQSLKSLKLSCVCIFDGFLQHLFCRSQSLESITIDGEIDASDLVPLEYMGDQIPKFKIAKESSQLKHSRIVLDCWSGNLNASWFFKLRKFLSNLISWSQVSLDFHICNEIDGKDMQLHHIGAPPKVDVLNVDIKSDRGFPTFVDALLWSCHSRKLILTSSIEMITCFMDRLMFMKNLSHSTSRGSKSRHNQLKEIKVFDEKNQPLELRSGKLAIRNLMKREKVYFLLDWW